MKNIQTLVYYKDNRAYIPTRGLATSVNDMYRAAHFHKTSDEIFNQGMIFHESYNDIGIFQNEIKSMDDLLKFESMLRFILLKEHLYVVEPSIRTTTEFNGNVFDSYSRIPQYALESSDLIFQNVNASNRLFPIEKIKIKDGIVTDTTNVKSIYLKAKQSDIPKLILTDQLSKDFLHTIPQSLSIPFLENIPTSENSYNKIFEDFLKSLDKNYKNATEYIVKYGYKIPLPFFSNAIFSIAKNRDDIPNAIAKLRNDMEPLRNKLFHYESQFNNSISSTRDLAMLQKDIESTINSYTQKIYEPGNIFNDTIRLGISLAKNPNEMLGKMFNPHYTLNKDYPFLFGESNYKRMKNIISKENISTNIEHILTPQEIKNISA
tara:strand:+ start:279 stop:1409 length:1131 start_codon:yes stop_codon:yes gene_type:complete